MNCKEIENQLIDYIDHTLEQEEVLRIDRHINKCDTCSIALQELTSILKEIDTIPQEIPSKHLKSNFDTMLDNEKSLLNNTKVVSLSNKPKEQWKTALQIVATIALVVCSFYFGKFQNTESTDTEVANLKKEKVELKQKMTMSLIDNESASKRLQAVNYAEELENPGNDILKALIQKMHYDNHSNVRLAAAEALAKFSDSEIVRKALIHALEMEQEPGMQIELIQILVSIQEKRASPSMEKLLQNEETPSYVKDQLKIGLPNLI